MTTLKNLNKEKNQLLTEKQNCNDIRRKYIDRKLNEINHKIFNIDRIQRNHRYLRAEQLVERAQNF